MKILTLVPLLVLIAICGSIVAPQTAKAGLQMQCGYEYVYRYGYRKLNNGRLGYAWAFDRVFQCKNVWVCLPFNC